MSSALALSACWPPRAAGAVGVCRAPVVTLYATGVCWVSSTRGGIDRVTNGTVRLHISTNERRYILHDDATIERELRSSGAPVEYQPGRSETEITTVYLDTAEGTWSRGRSRTKI